MCKEPEDHRYIRLKRITGVVSQFVNAANNVGDSALAFGKKSKDKGPEILLPASGVCVLTALSFWFFHDGTLQGPLCIAAALAGVVSGGFLLSLPVASWDAFSARKLAKVALAKQEGELQLRAASDEASLSERRRHLESYLDELRHVSENVEGDTEVINSIKRRLLGLYEVSRSGPSEQVGTAEMKALLESQKGRRRGRKNA